MITFFWKYGQMRETRSTAYGTVLYVDSPATADILFAPSTSTGKPASRKYLVTASHTRYKTLKAAARSVSSRGAA